LNSFPLRAKVYTIIESSNLQISVPAQKHRPAEITGLKGPALIFMDFVILPVNIVG